MLFKKKVEDVSYGSCFITWRLATCSPVLCVCQACHVPGSWTCVTSGPGYSEFSYYGDLSNTVFISNSSTVIYPKAVTFWTRAIPSSIVSLASPAWALQHKDVFITLDLLALKKAFLSLVKFIVRPESTGNWFRLWIFKDIKERQTDRYICPCQWLYVLQLGGFSGHHLFTPAYCSCRVLGICSPF